MTNEEKAKLLECDDCIQNCGANMCYKYRSLLQMAEWKEKEMLKKFETFMWRFFDTRDTEEGAEIYNQYFTSIDETCESFREFIKDENFRM